MNESLPGIISKKTSFILYYLQPSIKKNIQIKASEVKILVPDQRNVGKVIEFRGGAG